MDEAELCWLLVGASADGMWLLDPDGVTLYANARMAELLGRTPEEMVGLSVYDALEEKERSPFAEHLRRAGAGVAGPDDQAERYVRGDGTPIWLLASWRPVRAADGSLVGFLHQYSDHTEMRGRIESLERREQLMREAQVLTRIGSWEWDVVRNRSRWSDQLYDIYGVGRDVEATLAGYLAVVHPADRERVRSAVSAVLHGADSFEVTARIVRGDDGRVRWCHGLGRVERDHQGEPVRVIGTNQDVTERISAEQEVEAYTRRLGLLSGVAEAANSSTSMVEALTRARQALSAALGWELTAAFVGGDDELTLLDLAEDGSSPASAPDVELAARTSQTRKLHHRALVGSTSSRSLVAVPVLLGSELACVMEVVVDEMPPAQASQDLMVQLAVQLGRVAERERAAAELAEARDQAVQASRLKSEFLATMSHEIRTPMNGVIGLTELLLRADLGGHERRLTEALHGAGLTLRGMIDDILDLSKIEAGRLELESADFEVRRVLSQTMELLQVQAAGKGLRLDLDIDASVPTHVRGDPTRWAQILTNLGSNAVKFTDSGAVSIDVSSQVDDLGRPLVEVSVTDTGPGISPEAQERIFDAFTQADSSTTRSHGGTGLGLAISARLVEALGGTLTLDSAVGRGSVFRFTTPFAAAGEAPAPARSVPLVQQTGVLGPRILVVEDDELNQMVAVGLLEHAGFAVEVVGDGAQAVEALGDGHGYAAVLMDCRMPHMDGFAATRAIRGREAAGRRVPIIAMTASALAGERDRCLEAGMDDFLTKPVDPQRLHRVVHHWMARSVQDAVPADQGRRPADPSPQGVVDASRFDMLHGVQKEGQTLFQSSSANFLAQAADRIEAIRGAVEAADAERLTRAAHQLKGSALNLGLPRVGAAASDLEQHGRADTVAEARAALEALTVEMDRAVAALERERAVRR